MTLRRLGDLLFIATCVSLLAVIAMRAIARAPGVPPAREGTVQRDGGFPEFASSAGVRRVVLILSPTCRYCSLSVPFYTKLVGLSDGYHSSYDVVVSSRVPREQMLAYLHKNGLDSIPVIDEPPPRETSATPTILVLDEQGGLLRSWRGKLSADQERQLVADVSGTLR